MKKIVIITILFALLLIRGFTVSMSKAHIKTRIREIAGQKHKASRGNFTTAEAATVSIADCVIEKDGKFYAIDIQTYYDLKGINHALLQEVTLTYIQSSNGKIYSVSMYQDAQAVGGNMGGAFEILESTNSDEQVDTGTVNFGSDGKPEFIEGENNGGEGEVKEFEVLSIE